MMNLLNQGTYPRIENPFHATIYWTINQNANTLIHGLWKYLSAKLNADRTSMKEFQQLHPEINWASEEAFVTSIEEMMNSSRLNWKTRYLLSEMLALYVRACIKEKDSLQMEFPNPIREDFPANETVRSLRRIVSAAIRLYILTHLGLVDQVRMRYDTRARKWLDVLGPIMSANQFGLYLSPLSIRVVINPCIQRTITEMVDFLCLDSENEERMTKEIEKMFTFYTYHEEKEDLMSYYVNRQE